MKDKLEELFGKIFYCDHSYRSPDVVRIVGWTPNAEKINAKIRYVYVEPVKIQILSNDLYGGSCCIDKGWLDNNQLPNKPIKKPKYEKLILDYNDNHVSLRKCEHGVINCYLEEENIDQIYHWCEY